MPKKQRRQRREDEPHVQKVFYRWGTAEILVLLRSVGPTRFTDIVRQLPNVSEQVVSSRLADLQQIRMIDRVVSQDRPIVTTYSLTPIGMELAEVADGLKAIASSDRVPSIAA